MKKEKRIFGRTIRWTWAGAAAIVFHIALYWSVALTRDSHQQLRRQERQFTEIQYFDSESAGRSELLNQQMSLFDPRPLLLPTQWNVANPITVRDLLQEEGEIFPSYTPLFEVEDGNYIEDFGNVPATYDQLSIAQVEFNFPPFKQLGRQAWEREYTPAEGLFLLARDPKSGETLASATIYNDDVRAMDEGWPEWGPATLLATVENSFQVGGISVVSSSGIDEVDARLREIALRNFPDLGQLQDGVYLLEFVP